jgi:hypothetical protein
MRSTLMGALAQRFDAVMTGSSPGHIAGFS